MKYDFNTEKGQFFLYDPETGKEWSNFLFNDMGYICTVAHTGATSSRYLNEDAISIAYNDGQSFFYVRDEENKKFWNIGGYPTIAPIHEYCCEHAQTYTKISSVTEEIAGEIVYTVDPHDTRELWRVTLTNRSDETRTLSLFTYTQFSLGGFSQPFYYNMKTTCATEFCAEAGGLWCESQNPFKPHKRCSGYIVTSLPIKAYSGNGEVFIGTMGTPTIPRVIAQGLDCANDHSDVRSRAGILQSQIVLQKGESITVYYALGLAEHKDEIIQSRQQFYEECRTIFEKRLSDPSPFSSLSVNCPEPQINRVLNHWAEHQIRLCMVGKKAVRDNSQLAMGILNCDPDKAGEVIKECIVHQYSDGHSVLLWYPVVDKHVYSDPSCWLVYSICEYIKETGKIDFLDQHFAYLDGGEGSVWEHLEKAVEWLSAPENYGPNRLPKIHYADWNDALNIPDENAESVLMAMLIGCVYLEMEQLARYVGKIEYAEAVRAKYENLKNIVNGVAYNGEYYVRALSRFGTVGDRDAQNGGKIYVNPQSWSILSGICPEERRSSVLGAIDAMETDEGVPLCSPAYVAYDEAVGRMSGMLPGIYENGGIYNHAGCFKVMADCRIGRGENAVDTLLKILPDGKSNPSHVTTTEPYVFTNCYLKHPNCDMRVGTAWKTGTSAWGLMCCYEGILGLQRHYDGLHIQPSFPIHWKTVDATRNFRGNKLKLRYVNKGGSSVALKVDGKPIEGNVVPLFSDFGEHTVEVTLV